MDSITRKITKEEYDRLSALSYGERNAEIEKGLSPAIIYGYGYYGHRLTESNGEYELVLSIGSSCD